MTQRARIGMTMLLIAQAVFFSLLIGACTYFRALPRLYVPFGAILAGVLLAGSVTIWRKWRWATVALGAIFVLGLAGTPFAMLTAVHGLFVLGGIVALAVIPASAIGAASLYWYFMSAVWLAIFGVAVRI